MAISILFLNGMFLMVSTSADNQLVVGGFTFQTFRPHSFGLVIDRQPIDGPAGSAFASDPSDECPADYLHDVLLAPANREAFLELIEHERLVVCKNVRSNASSYRKVNGKSSVVKLSQAEYYHHDGCSSPTKPKVVEIRCPYQSIARNIATAIAPFSLVIRAMVFALPESFLKYEEMESYRAAFSGSTVDYPTPESWDQIQGKVTRLVRRELDAEACRSYFRTVDQMADAYVLPWEMRESRLMLNSHSDLVRTMQHRRSYQKARGPVEENGSAEQNGSLLKRWTAEEA